VPRFKVAVIGGGILGCAVAYFLSSSMPSGSVAIIEQEEEVAYHASSRNTGKVHAPFLYDPVKKRLFARAAYLGFEMWRRYAEETGLPFKTDGVLEVSTDRQGLERLNKYLKWGTANGLQQEELRLLEPSEVRRLEPNVNCEAALLCTRDASVDYGAFTRSLAEDCRRFGTSILLGRRVVGISGAASGLRLDFESGGSVEIDFLVNTGGGRALAIARLMGLAQDLSALYFRGEYWRAPAEYEHLTQRSIYSVPKHPEYPFLDPHWIVRVNGQVDVGPNAVPVTGADAYDWSMLMKRLPGFVFEALRGGALRIFLDSEFLTLAGGEWQTSLSKGAMIRRIREFLPQVNPEAFVTRGFGGIRSVLVNTQGKFVDDAAVLREENSINVLNYNSPGATGALPMGAFVASETLERLGLGSDTRPKGLWNPDAVAERMSN
jgi:(S)-2-hydroxyglutarate dehydrogenase